MKIADVPPWRAYVCIAFLTENIEGALRGIECASRDEGTVLHRLAKTLLVDWHLDRDVWEVLVNFWVWIRLYCGIVHRIFVVLGNWTENETNVANELKAEELSCKVCYENEEGTRGRTIETQNIMGRVAQRANLVGLRSRANSSRRTDTPDRAKSNLFVSL